MIDDIFSQFSSLLNPSYIVSSVKSLARQAFDYLIYEHRDVLVLICVFIIMIIIRFIAVLKEDDSYSAFWNKSAGFFYPIVPSNSSSIKLFISTAYSTGSAFEIGFANPLTINALASCSDSPLDIK